MRNRTRGDNQLRLLFWELTTGCNLSCIHCRAVAQPGRAPDELSTEEAKGIIDQLVAFAQPILILTGGEPLYRPDVFEIASYATSKGLRVALATNGTLVTDSVARRIVEAGLKRVSISLDGGKAETHDTFRGLKGSFAAALAGFENLKRHGMSLQFNTTIARHNADEVEDVLDLALRLGADALHIFMLVPVGCGLQIASSEMLPARDYERILDWFYRKSREVGIELKATCAPHYFRIMYQRAREAGIRVTRETHGMAAMTKGCLAGTGVCFLSHKGRVQPCGYLPVEAGDVRKEPFRQIWEESLLFQELRDPDLLKGKCGICEYKTVCEGCRARAFAEKGDYLEEEPYCIYVPRRAWEAGT